MSSVTAFAALNAGLANSVGGTSGCGERRSTSTNATSARTPAAAVPPPRPRSSRPSPSVVRPQVRRPSPSTAEDGPRQVEPGRRIGSRLSGTCRSAKTKTTAASGRLIRKTARQVHSTSHPPKNGPTAPATPPNPDQAPTAAARSGPWNDAEISARLPGVSSAPPTPCNARAAMRTGDVRGQPAGERRQREPRHPDEEDPPTAEVVAQRPAEQDERRQRQRVGVDRPLQIAEARVELGADARQRDVDDGAVDHHDPGAQHGGGEHPAACRRAHPQPARLGHSRTVGRPYESGRSPSGDER